MFLGKLSEMAEKGRKKAQAAFTSARIAVDFPQQGESVSSREYAIRISASAAVKQVEASVDGGAWQSCRPSEGFWWCDWRGYPEGPHVLSAHAQTDAGKEIVSRRRKFSVNF